MPGWMDKLIDSGLYVLSVSEICLFFYSLLFQLLGIYRFIGLDVQMNYRVRDCESHRLSERRCWLPSRLKANFY